MRSIDSDYDRRISDAVTSLLETLRRAYPIETLVTGSVIVNGVEFSRSQFERAALFWQGDFELFEQYYNIREGEDNNTRA